MPKGKDFIKLWNNSYKDGALKDIANHFKISTCTADKIRRKLKLPLLHDWKNHPGKRAFFKRIRKLYVSEERSTEEIARIVGMHSQNINQILRKINVELRPRHITNNLRIPTSNTDMTHNKLLQSIKRMYVDEKITAENIAKSLGIDPATVRTKLKGMKIPIRHNQTMVKGGYPCRWCNIVMKEVYHNHGPRKQIYCCSSCANKAKDYRRMKKGIRVSINRIKMMEEFLREAWKDKYEEAKALILNAKPVIESGKKPTYERSIRNYSKAHHGI